MEEAVHFDFDVEVVVPLLIDHEDEESILGEEEEEEELSNGGFLEPNEDSDQGDVAVESLDYDSIHNVVHDQLLTKQHRRRLYGSEQSQIHTDYY